jgi:hypothetical protein
VWQTKYANHILDLPTEMTEGEKHYQDKVHSLMYIAKYALDLFRLYLLMVDMAIKTGTKEKKWFVDEEEAA